MIRQRQEAGDEVEADDEEDKVYDEALVKIDRERKTPSYTSHKIQ